MVFFAVEGQPNFLFEPQLVKDIIATTTIAERNTFFIFDILMMYKDKYMSGKRRIVAKITFVSKLL